MRKAKGKTIIKYPRFYLTDNWLVIFRKKGSYAEKRSRIDKNFKYISVCTTEDSMFDSEEITFSEAAVCL